MLLLSYTALGILFCIANRKSPEPTCRTLVPGLVYIRLFIGEKCASGICGWAFSPVDLASPNTGSEKKCRDI